MVPVPFVLAAVSLSGAFAVAAWAAGWRPALGVVGATVLSVTTASLDGPTAALALLFLAVLIAVRYPWHEPIDLEIVIGEDGRAIRIRRR